MKGSDAIGEGACLDVRPDDAVGFDHGTSLGINIVKCWHTAKMEEGVGNAPTSGLSRSCFRDRCSQLLSACLPEMVRVVPQARDTCVFLLPRWWPRANARLLLTLHPEIGCQTWTRTKTNGLTDRRATLTPPGNGAAGRTSTCIVPLRRRVPHVFGHDSI